MSERTRVTPDEYLGKTRRDVQGLRAIAVLLVVLAHAGVPHLDGGYVGVDVFFVISGFLITGLLLKRSAGDGHFSFIEFYARRATRILPAAALVLVVTVIAARHMLPPLQAKGIAEDSIWAMFFVANVRFANVGTDYFAQDQPASAVQHFWSLAVEEQFYLAWPVLLAVVLLGAHMFTRSHYGWRPGHRDFRRAGVILLVITGASLVWSIAQTESDPTGAYFSSLTRAWELGVGALVALWSAQLGQLQRAVRLALAPLGLVLVLIAAVAFTDATPFPGYAALLPVLGTAALLVAGLADEEGASRLLGLQPFRYIGDISYSLYLWHWPILILAEGYWGEELSVSANLALMVGAVALSSLTYHLYENPLRHGRILSPNAAGMGLAWGLGICAVLWTSVIMGTNIDDEIALARAAEAEPILIDTTPDNLETTPATTNEAPAFVTKAVEAALAGDPVPDRTAPALSVAAEDREDLGTCSGAGRAAADIEPCTFGAENGSRSVVLLGDSHAEMWIPAFDIIGQNTDTTVHPLTKPGCRIVVASLDDPDCAEWWVWAQDRIAELDPDIIVLANLAGSGELWRQGMTPLVDAIKASTDRIIILGETPDLIASGPQCLQSRSATLDECAWPPQRGLAEVDNIGGSLPGTEYIQTSQWFCAENLCPSVIGNVVVYTDNNHMTATYAKQLAPLLQPRLSKKS